MGLLKVRLSTVLLCSLLPQLSSALRVTTPLISLPYPGLAAPPPHMLCDHVLQQLKSLANPMGAVVVVNLLPCEGTPEADSIELAFRQLERYFVGVRVLRAADAAPNVVIVAWSSRAKHWVDTANAAPDFDGTFDRELLAEGPTAILHCLERNQIKCHKH